MLESGWKPESKLSSQSRNVYWDQITRSVLSRLPRGLWPMSGLNSHQVGFIANVWQLETRACQVTGTVAGIKIQNSLTRWSEFRWSIMGIWAGLYLRKFQISRPSWATKNTAKMVKSRKWHTSIWHLPWMVCLGKPGDSGSFVFDQYGGLMGIFLAGSEFLCASA